MNVYVLDSSYTPVAVIDSFKSLIWTKRYYECGDFELFIPADSSILPYIQPDYFLTRDDDDSAMVIEKLEVDTDAGNGDFFIVSGRCVKSILGRRIFNRQFVVSADTINDAVQDMVTECTTVHSTRPETYRQIPGLTVDTSNEFPAEIQAQFTGQTLLNGIISLTQPKEIGTKLSIVGSSLVLSFYQGSYNGVVFSPEFDNLANSKYVFDKTNLKNSADVAGEGEGAARVWVSVINTTFANRPRGLALRELFVDARDISSNDGEIDLHEYYNMLFSRGNEKLAEHSISKAYEAQVEPAASYVYKRDYDLGDVVTVSNEYGITSKPRIVEIVESWDETGYTVIPKFDVLDVEETERTVLMDSDGYILKDSEGNILCERT